MDFDKGYDHLTKEQRVYLKKKLAPEGSFFMKGKHPKTVRTPPVVIAVRGAPKASGYQRLSEKEQEVVNQYVENLVAAVLWTMVKSNPSCPEEGRFTKGCCRLTQSQQVRGRRQLCYAGHSGTLGSTRRV